MEAPAVPPLLCYRALRSQAGSLLPVDRKRGRVVELQVLPPLPAVQYVGLLGGGRCVGTGGCAHAGIWRRRDQRGRDPFCNHLLLCLRDCVDRVPGHALGHDL